MVSYHKFERNLESLLVLLPSVYYRASYRLDQHKGVESDSNAVMWVGQGSWQANSLKSQYERSGGQDYSQYLQPDMEPQRGTRIAVVEASHEDGRRNDEKEGYRSENSVGGDICLVVWHAAKSISHA